MQSGEIRYNDFYYGAVCPDRIYSPFTKTKERGVTIERKEAVYSMKLPIKKILIAALAVLFLFTGCEDPKETTDEGPITEFSYEMLDLSIVADEIYKEQDLSDLTRKSVRKITDETTLAEQFYLDMDKIVDYEVRAAEGNFGVADLMLLRVKEGSADEVMAEIENRKDDRINEFSHYDVYNAYDTALSAEIYQEGDIVIMLMFPTEGKTAAKAVLDRYLP